MLLGIVAEVVEKLRHLGRNLYTARRNSDIAELVEVVHFASADRVGGAVGWAVDEAKRRPRLGALVRWERPQEDVDELHHFRLALTVVEHVVAVFAVCREHRHSLADEGFEDENIANHAHKFKRRDGQHKPPPAEAQFPVQARAVAPDARRPVACQRRVTVGPQRDV